MATQFTATVKPSGGDYTSLSDAVTGLANDITVADIKVFSISAHSTPTIAAGDTVLGQSSLATGVCVLVNAARTQILIKTIVGTFQSTETVQKTAVPTVNVTLSNIGDSPIIGIACYSMSDTTVVVIDGTFATSSTNYLYIYTPLSERHNGKWNDTKYRLDISTNDDSIDISDTNFIRIEGLQIFNRQSYNCIYAAYLGQAPYDPADIRIDTCILRGNGIVGGSGATGDWGNGVITVQNCLSYDNYTSGFEVGDENISWIIRNCTSANNGYGYNDDAGGIMTCTNCLSYGNTTADFSGAITATYSASSDATVPVGTGNLSGQVFSFVDPTGTPKDFHLKYGDTGARTHGTNLSIYFTTDIDGDTRPPTGTWDIGSDQYIYRQSRGYIII